MRPYRNRAKLERAKQLRGTMTFAEVTLWNAVRENQLGFHFRRQEVIGPFIADFYCRRARVAVEVDGGVHDDQIEADTERDQFFHAHHIMVLRFKNDEVTNNVVDVCRRIREACEASRPV